MRYISSIIFVIAFFENAAAITYHVAKSGNDNDRGTFSNPFLTINKGASLAMPGDTVMVHAGVYREWVVPVRGAYSENSRITYMAAAGEHVVIKGSEQITQWQNQGNHIWKADVPDSIFGEYHPYITSIAGRYTSDYIRGGAWCHLGEVFLDGKRFDEKQFPDALKDTVNSWYTTHQNSTTSLFANFSSANPNRHLAEICVRESIFGNPFQASGINYITVDGFEMSQSAEEWTPTYLDTPQVSHAVIFVSGTHWIIQNCTVTYAKMRGISIDGPDVNANHIIRDNVVKYCGVSGIAGCYAHGSVISGNWIQNIGERTYWGVEHAGIKIHLCKNLLISGNIIYKVTAKNWGMGIWLDYANDGNRVSGNVVIKTSDEWLRPENPTGINLFDNNLGFDCGEAMLEDGTVFVHNFTMNASIRYQESYVGTGVGENGRIYNNIFVGKSIGQFDLKKNNKSDFNLFINGAPETEDDIHSITGISVTDLTYTVDENKHMVTLILNPGNSMEKINCPVITTENIGMLNDGASLHKPNGQPIAIDRDINQNKRGDKPTVGPFQNLTIGKNIIYLLPNSKFIW